MTFRPLSLGELILTLTACFVILHTADAGPVMEELEARTHIVLLGNGLGSQMLDYGEFETRLHQAFPGHRLVVRNLCFEGDTATYRPRAGRNAPWAFPGAEKVSQGYPRHRGKGVEPSPNEWLEICQADIILGFFGYNESFKGPEGLRQFTAELEAWIEHSKAQSYNGEAPPRLVLVSPIAFENLSSQTNLPKSDRENANLILYAEAMAKVAARHGVGYVDLFHPTNSAMKTREGPFTLNGFLPNTRGNRLIADLLMEQLFGIAPAKEVDGELLKAVLEKNWMWRHDYRIVNGVHVYGRRRAPYGTVNYPPEIEKTRQLTANRDQAIWAQAQGKPFDLEAADAATRQLEPIETNFRRDIDFIGESDSIESFKMMDGFKIELFAAESDFTDLRNPINMSFDNRGRLWVCVSPSYPAYRPGDPKPDDKLIIFEDTDDDGKADKQTVFADGLHLPMGFELAADGVYVAQQPDLVLLQDRDGDGKADHREVVLRGFDPHDTHHSIGAFCVDPMGGLYMPEGIFLHSQVETAYGPRRNSWSGVWRYDPFDQRIERYSRSVYANPWGIAFDDWGQCYIADASPGTNWWGLPLSVRMPPGKYVGKTKQFAPKRARPTSGAEFISSRHFPEELQGGYMVNNVIGFHGTSIHNVREDGSGFTGEHRGDLLSSRDPNFRPVDLEFAPDGSLYILDWHNPLIGHMQHSTRDPKRDHDHGRIYRVTYPERPLVKPVKIAGASIDQLLKALEEPEIRTRYRARRELRKYSAEALLPKIQAWLEEKDTASPRYEHHLLEALWATAGSGKVDPELLDQALNASAHQVRAAAVDVVRFRKHTIPNHTGLLLKAASDSHPRVRLAAMVAASWLDNEDGAKIASAALEQSYDMWMTEAYEAALGTLQPYFRSLALKGALKATGNSRTRAFLEGRLSINEERKKKAPEPKLPPEELALFRHGKEVYAREAHCVTCHGEDGKGTDIYPPLTPNAWVRGDDERLIKIALKGLWGPINVADKTYDPGNGVPPMTAFEHLLDDRELAAVLTYVRHSFGNKGPSIKPEQVEKVRAETKDKQSYYLVEEILEEHPIP
ncbi:dehydrogenase [Coraliomargarita sinensis]|uniref:Dehydrogenase n=1 Tax=Coraliomargarita sinensis TaxID=2174842 RepID=A0A317ZIJ5_9BACT|nr:PVC-type heme-binding CxxCH protein [Coraliomargarita sinensis]PXA03201.1 dehydrogenase [Coraliomargarita sinensis]